MKKIAPSFDGEKCTAKVRLDRISADERELCHSQNPHFIGGGGSGIDLCRQGSKMKEAKNFFFFLEN